MRIRDCFYLSAACMIVGFTATACSREPQNKPEAPTAEGTQRGNTQVIVDGLTGRHAVQAGQKAKEQIRQIAEQRDKDLEQF